MKLKRVLIIIILGFVLTFLAFLSPVVIGFGGEFSSITGRSNVPVGFPLPFLKQAWPSSYSFPDDIPVGQEPLPQFHLIPFIADLLFWIIIVFSIRFVYQKLKK